MTKLKIETVIIDIFGNVTDRMEIWIKKIWIYCPVEILQNGRLLYTARMIGKVMLLTVDGYACITYQILLDIMIIIIFFS